MSGDIEYLSLSDLLDLTQCPQEQGWIIIVMIFLLLYFITDVTIIS